MLVATLLAAPPAITYRDGGFIATGKLSFAVSLHQPDAPALDGTLAHTSNETIFTPRYPPQPGATYRIDVTGQPPILIRVPDRAPRPPATLTAVYPSASVLPENQLKLYLHFSAPMSRSEAVRRIRLLRQNGESVSLPFLEIDEELWDPDARRLTLLFDPGRIKRGLLPRQEVGAALIPGERYTLVIDAAWPDAYGQPLAQGIRHEFTAGPADRTPVNPRTWRLTPTAKDLLIDFGEPLDSALAPRLIRVLDVPGQVVLEQNETRLRFTPHQPWKPGTYTLEVHPALEDLAGNRVNRPFDVDRFDRVTTIQDREPPTQIVFTVR